MCGRSISLPAAVIAAIAVINANVEAAVEALKAPTQSEHSAEFLTKVLGIEPPDVIGAEVAASRKLADARIELVHAQSYVVLATLNKGGATAETLADSILAERDASAAYDAARAEVEVLAVDGDEEGVGFAEQAVTLQ